VTPEFVYSFVRAVVLLASVVAIVGTLIAAFGTMPAGLSLTLGIGLMVLWLIACIMWLRWG
jgi:hypothetical protein